jgi:hypothetical protein
VIAPALDGTGQILEPLVTTTKPVVAPLASRAAQSSATPLGPVQDTTTPTGQTGLAGGPTQQQGVVGPARGPQSASTTRSHVSPVRPQQRDSARSVPAMAPQFRFHRTFVAISPDGASSPHQTTASRPSAPHSPFAPDGPFGLALAAATAGASFFLPLFAVLAATFLLAAQGVGRRLRPTLAPPQLPILALSLERPG